MSIVPGRDIPEVPQEWVDAVNKAINDANHEDLCACRLWPDACPYYKPGQWDLGVDLTIAVAALEPLIRARVEAEQTSRAWLFWSPDGTLLDVADYENEPVTREHAQARYAADRDMPPATAEPVPYEALPAIRALCQQAGPDGRQVTRDDLKEIL